MTPPGPPSTDSRQHDEFEAFRPRLFGLAYRMTASVADAEDICQDTWVRWQGVDPASVRSSEAFLVSVATRLAIDRLRSATQRRETYVGPWLPEPLPDAVAGSERFVASGTRETDPEAGAELADSLTFGFLTLLDELEPRERAVLLLHDVFGHDFAATAAAVGISADSARQAASRARRKIRRSEDDVAGTSLSGHDATTRERLEQLLMAMATGDSKGVLDLLAPGVVQIDDGGERVRAARRPVVGADRVTRFLVNLARRMMHEEPELRWVEVNHAPALFMSVAGRPRAVMTCAVGADGLIHRIWVQLNPDKLQALSSFCEPEP